MISIKELVVPVALPEIAAFNHLDAAVDSTFSLRTISAISLCLGAAQQADRATTTLVPIRKQFSCEVRLIAPEGRRVDGD